MNNGLNYQEVLKAFFVNTIADSPIYPGSEAICPNCNKSFGNHEGTLCIRGSGDYSKFWPLEDLVKNKDISLDDIFSFIFFKR